MEFCTAVDGARNGAYKDNVVLDTPYLIDRILQSKRTSLDLEIDLGKTVQRSFNTGRLDQCLNYFLSTKILYNDC